MTPLVAIGGLIALASIGGAAYLLALWHEDQAGLRAHGERVSWRTWPVSRVIAYLAIGACVASNVLAGVAMLRLLEVPNFLQIRDALQPFTLAAVIYLDVVFTILALYLRIVRWRSGKAQTIRDRLERYVGGE